MGWLVDGVAWAWCAGLDVDVPGRLACGWDWLRDDGWLGKEEGTFGSRKLSRVGLGLILGTAAPYVINISSSAGNITYIPGYESCCVMVLIRIRAQHTHTRAHTHTTPALYPVLFKCFSCRTFDVFVGTRKVVRALGPLGFSVLQTFST